MFNNISTVDKIFDRTITIELRFEKRRRERRSKQYGKIPR